MLAEAPVTDVGPLDGLSALLELQLQGTRVEDAGPLTTLAQLQGLNLSRTPVRDVAALAALRNLQWIDLSGGGSAPSPRPRCGAGGRTSRCSSGA